MIASPEVGADLFRPVLGEGLLQQSSHTGLQAVLTANHLSSIAEDLVELGGVDLGFGLRRISHHGLLDQVEVVFYLEHAHLPRFLPRQIPTFFRSLRGGARFPAVIPVPLSSVEANNHFHPFAH
jgi:hypothetical protein